MADEPPPPDKSKGDEPAKDPDDSAEKPAEEKPPKADQPAGGRSIGSVVASDRLTAISATIAAAVQTKAGERAIVIVEDRAVALSSLPLREVRSSLTMVNELLTLIDAAVQSAPTPPPAIEVIIDLDEEEDAGAGAGESQVAADEAGGEATPPNLLDALKQVSEVLKFVGSTVEIAPQEVAVDRTAITAAVAGRITGKRIVWPSAAGITSAPVLADARATMTQLVRSTIAVDRLAQAWSPTAVDIERRLAHLASLTKTRDEVVKTGDDVAATRLAAEILVEERRVKAASEGDYSRAMATVLTARATLESAKAALQAVNTQTPPGLSPIQTAAMREHVDSIAGIGDWAALWVDVTAMGGDRAQRSSPLGWNSEVSYLGAGQATYLLVAKDGQLLASDAQAAFGFRSFDFNDFVGSMDPQQPWRVPRRLNVELFEVLAVIVMLVIVLLIIQKVFA
jgi:hypothetical protein